MQGNLVATPMPMSLSFKLGMLKRRQRKLVTSSPLRRYLLILAIRSAVATLKPEVWSLALHNPARMEPRKAISSRRVGILNSQPEERTESLQILICHHGGHSPWACHGSQCLWSSHLAWPLSRSICVSCLSAKHAKILQAG